MQIDRVFRKYTEAIEAHLKKCIPGGSTLSTVAQKSLSSGGKRIRPLLALLSCEAVSGDYRPAIPISITYEMAHTASLMQDDIIDKSEFRRGRRTLHSEYGSPFAILVSDMLVFEIFNKVAEYEEIGVAPELVFRLLRYLGAASTSATLGEYLDGQESFDVIDVDRYLEIAKLKTGSLMAASAASGAVVGGAVGKLASALYRFGEATGVAYQIRDDVLDIIGDPDVMHKPVFSDLRNRGKNIVLIHAFRNAPSSKRKFLKSMLGKSWYSEEEKIGIKNVFTDLGSIDYAGNLSITMLNTAKEQLSHLKAQPAGEHLELLARFAVNRMM
ncbi:MAG: polyprenyl synthetase family protein [Nitrososphaerales archaeon]